MPVLDLLAKNHEFIFPALASPVLALGQEQRGFSSKARVIAVIQNGEVDLFCGGPDAAADRKAWDRFEQLAAQLLKAPPLLVSCWSLVDGLNKRI
jgi:hypothetical protein